MNIGLAGALVALRIQYGYVFIEVLSLKHNACERQKCMWMR